MKKLFSIIILIVISVNSFAQFVYDANGKIIPFSLSKEYKQLIDTATVNTCMLPSYNNDSLYWEANFETMYIKKNYKSVKAGFPIDTLIDLKNVANKYELPGGTAWLYKIESKTAEGIGIIFRKFDIPEGALLSIYSSETSKSSHNLSVYGKNDWDNSNPQTKFWHVVDGNTLFIEYFEPKYSKSETQIVISSIDYIYDMRKKKSVLKTLPNHLKKSIPTSTLNELKAADENCQYDVVCPGVPDYKNESKSICYIEIMYKDVNFETQWGLGTGFFINKSNNYAETERPYIFSAGHNFNIYSWEGYIDFSNGYKYMEIYISKINKSCNDPTEIRFGTKITDPDGLNFKVIKLGNSYNRFSFPDYTQNEDYAIMQTAGTVGDYAKYGILYNAWSSSILYNSNNWVSLSHPDGMAMKIFVDEGKPTKPDPQNYVGFNFDKGYTMNGSSGAPIYNSDKQVVGWLCTSRSDATCSDVGSDDPINMTKFGDLGTIHSEIGQYIDPISRFSAPSYTAPLPELPAHCKNCGKDGDETDMDCGGSCLPCGIVEKKTIATQMEIQHQLKAKYDLEIIPNSGSQIALKIGDYNFFAGKTIKFQNGFSIKNGVNFKAQIDQSLMSEADRGCQEPCISVANVFSPNGDGINDYWGFNQTFITQYDVIIFDRYSQIHFSSYNNILSEPGSVSVWEGGGNSPNVYYYIITYTDCYGVTRKINGSIHLFTGSKKSDEESITLKTEIKNDDYKLIPSLNVYPNPTTGIITIEYTNAEIDYEYSIIDQYGKTIISNCANSKSEIDISGCPPGLYIIRIRVGNEYQARKIIKR